MGNVYIVKDSTVSIKSEFDSGEVERKHSKPLQPIRISFVQSFNLLQKLS